MHFWLILRICHFPVAILMVVPTGVFISSPTNAQVRGAKLSGTITDASGAQVPLSQFSSRNVATGIITLVTSNDAFSRIKESDQLLRVETRLPSEPRNELGVLTYRVPSRRTHDK